MRSIYPKQILVFTLCCFRFLCDGQKSYSDSLQQQFIAYQVKNYNEKIFVHTDKTFYITGETIWFKVYCVDEQLHKPSPVSKIAYVEIIDHENKPILQAKIGMNEGSGNGSFIIPSFVISGNYILRAYTRLMSNFDADYFFEEPLTIFNNFRQYAPADVRKQKTYSISFFPEGGNLVEGISSKVAFKTVDEYGVPAECSGVITSAHNDHVAEFRSFKFGMGSFIFTPLPGERYKAIVRIADTAFEAELPGAYSHGYVMRLEDQDNSSIKLTVLSNILSNDVFYLLVHSQNLIKDFQQKKSSSGEINFVIDKNALSDGISDFTIFDSHKQPVCERLYFKQPVGKLNIQIQPDKAIYQTKKQVAISLNATDKLNRPVIADMSVSVFLIDSLQSSNATDILSYLLLTSELKGEITSPGYYFQNGNKDAIEAADYLMLTQGWRRFKWEDVLQNKEPGFELIPEADGLVINGKITGRHNGIPAKDATVTLTVPGRNFQLSNAKTDDLGTLDFNLKNFYGAHNVILETDSAYATELAPSFSNKFSIHVNPFQMPLKWKEQLLFRSINVQAENAYLVDKKQRSYLYDAEDTSLFYGKPDKRYYLDDYTRFTTIEEIMREYVTEVRVGRTGGQFHFKVFNRPRLTFFENDPLILVDGLPVPNTNAVMDLDPLKIRSLDIVARKYYLGNTVYDGIVSYTTYNGDLGGFSLDASHVVINFEGLQREREFYSPAYNGGETNIPDFRNVLFWSPAIKTGTSGNAEIRFYTSEIKGKYACVIQGISQDGLPGSNIVTFNIQEQ